MSFFRALCILTVSLVVHPAFAQFDGAGFKQALKLKKNAYTGEGSITGGDRSTENYHVSQIRVAANPAGYDRVVVEISPSLAQAPFYLVENDPTNKHILVTLYGKPKLDFSRQTTTQQARKSKFLSKFEFLPIVDDDRWSYIIHTHVPVKVEVFELSNPARIIIDAKP
jgi:hypothetical protein